MPYRVGQTATDPKTGERIQFDGQNWVAAKGVAPTVKVGGGGRAEAQTAAFLNKLSTDAATARETQRVYQRARGDVKELQTGPLRGTYLGAAIPEDSGGFLSNLTDKIGAAVVGIPSVLTGALRQPDVDAYQRLRGLQNQQVLQAQLAQKGVQSESDAARMKLTEISPMKTVATNMDIINQGEQKARRAQAQSIFYHDFASKYGLYGRNPSGSTADQIWAKFGDQITEKYLGPAPGTGSVTIRVISRQKVR